MKKNKILIYIPAYNEELLIENTLLSIPNKIENYEVQILIIDDGSSDNTLQISKSLNVVNHIISLPENRGLAYSYNLALEFVIRNKFDLFLIFDADSQYNINDVPKFIKFINYKGYDVVIGNRKNIYDFYNKFQKYIHILGTIFISIVLGKRLKDPPSGFRLYNRKAIENNPVVYSRYTYTVESFFQYIDKKLSFIFVDSQVNKVQRKSRLYKSNLDYCLKIVNSLVMVTFLYKFHKISLFLALTSSFIGLILGLRYLFHFFYVEKEEIFLPSLILSAILFTIGIVLFAISVISYFLKNIRVTNEKINGKL